LAPAESRRGSTTSTSYAGTSEQRGLKARGHQSGLGLAQEVPDSPRLISLSRLELLQPPLSSGQLLRLPLSKPLVPLYQLNRPGIQAGLPNISSKLTCCDYEVSILQSLLLRFKSGLVTVKVGLAGGKGLKLVAKLDVV
jgi:hypothetical protein